jgi:hypothetical protein
MGAGRARERLCRTGELSGLLEMLSDISWIPESITSRKQLLPIFRTNFRKEKGSLTCTGFVHENLKKRNLSLTRKLPK